MQTAYATKHATARVRQRGIPASLVELLIQYGQELHDGHGARVVRFNRHSRSLLKKELGAKVYAMGVAIECLRRHFRRRWVDHNWTSSTSNL